MRWIAGRPREEPLLSTGDRGKREIFPLGVFGQYLLEGPRLRALGEARFPSLSTGPTC